MNLILPVAGMSSRFPGVKPKWLLTHPNGNLLKHMTSKMACINSLQVLDKRIN